MALSVNPVNDYNRSRFGNVRVTLVDKEDAKHFWSDCLTNDIYFT